MSTPPREFDLVVFGATGFTGGLVATYLAQRLHGSDTRWALAGRSLPKLEQVRNGLVSLDPALATLPLLEARSDDRASLDALVSRARVVLTTVGPYVQHGVPLATACAEHGTDYVDITGEPDFVATLLRDVDAKAKASGARLVSCCGFDSIPHDLGAWFTVRQLGPSEPIDLSGIVSASGTFSGGTWQSAVGAFSKAGREVKAPRVPIEGEGRTVGRLKGGLRFSALDRGWLVPLPTIDPQVVLRSARARTEYGPAFRYAHYARVKNTSTIVGGGIFLGGVFALAQLKPTRALLLKFKGSGEGPSEERRARARFTVTFRAKTPTRTLVTRVTGGDPGYTETSKMVSEAALALLRDRDRLPPNTGVLTTAQAFGDVLVERLQAAGIKFEVVPEKT